MRSSVGCDARRVADHVAGHPPRADHPAHPDPRGARFAGRGSRAYNGAVTGRRLRASIFRIGGSPLLLLTVAPASAHAYFDPGTGSMVLQALLAALVGAGLMLKGLRARLVAFVRRLLRPGARG